jgi:uncharacterized membrane protein YtjA (UPF0391 family)
MALTAGFQKGVIMFGKLSVLLLVILIVAGILGFAPLPGLASVVVALAQIVFFVVLVMLVIALFDALGDRSRYGRS